jgi:hypothetical protein
MVFNHSPFFCFCTLLCFFSLYLLLPRMLDMRYLKSVITITLISLFIVFIVSCKKDNPITEEPNPEFGKVSFTFSHKVEGQPLAVDTFLYTNAAGNSYLISNIQYFISDISLHEAGGAFYTIAQDNGIHYIDSDVPSSQTWSVTDNIPTGDYQSISFTFGINETKNQSNMYVNPPESNMFWPEALGGGYHYMKLNGEWIDTIGSPRLFNFHLGIGQIYAGGVIIIDSITGFVQNYFTVTLPASSFKLEKDQTKTIKIVMNIESWFETPHIWDFDYWGGSIMQNQDAMQTIKENGVDVFTIDTIQ